MNASTLFDEYVLYRLTAHNRLMVWVIWVSEDGDMYTIRTKHGQLDGKMAVDKGKLVKKGKAGRTIVEQVLLKVNSMITVKTDMGYTTEKSGINEDFAISPMLAQNW